MPVLRSWGSLDFWGTAHFGTYEKGEVAQTSVCDFKNQLITD